MNAIRLMEEAQKLPPGHVGRREAKDALMKEYAACFKLEELFQKKWKWRRRTKSLQEAADWSAFFCRIVGTSCVAYVQVEQMRPFVGAYYHPVSRSIRVPWGQIALTTMVHETAHHICFQESMFKGGYHGEDFLMVEGMIFDYLLKNPKEFTERFEDD